MSPSLPRRPERRFPRRTVRVLVDFQGSSGIRCEYATTLGAGGLFIETEEPLEIGSPIKVRFRLPGCDPIHEIEGRVVWHQQMESGEAPIRAPGMGIEFVDAAAAAALARDLDETG
jgi:type IV pilus assembly protein PilZ